MREHITVEGHGTWWRYRINGSLTGRDFSNEEEARAFAEGYQIAVSNIKEDLLRVLYPGLVS